GGPGTAVLTSIGAEDGYAGQLWIDGASSAVEKAGDKGFFTTDSYRLILSFDTSALPAGATIREARLRVTRRSLTGAVGSLSVDIRSGWFGRGAALAQDDYGAPASA